MGRLFLGMFVLAWSISPAVFAEARTPAPPPTTIEDPGIPRRTATPPPPSDPNRPDGFDEILQRRKDRQQEAVKADEKNRPSNLTLDKTVKELQKELEKPKPLRYFASLMLSVPKIQTQGRDRRDYFTEKSVLFHWFARLGSDPDFGKTQAWTGFRIAPFTGEGVYKNVAGRYGFTFFGPMIGVGNFSSVREASTADDSASAHRAAADDYTPPGKWRSGWMWMSGIALAHREIDTGEHGTHPKSEFQNGGLYLDGLGLWTEVSYAAVLLQTFSVQALAGVQLAEQKTFVYGAMGCGFWY